MATEQNFEFQLGETWVIDFDLNDQTGADIDLQGALVTFKLSRNNILALELSTDSSPGGVTLDSPPIGTGTITVSKDDQTGLIPEAYNYEVQALLVDQRTTTQAFGKIYVLASLFGWPL